MDALDVALVRRSPQEDEFAGTLAQLVNARLYGWHDLAANAVLPVLNALSFMVEAQKAVRGERS